MWPLPLCDLVPLVAMLSSSPSCPGLSPPPPRPSPLLPASVSPVRQALLCSLPTPCPCPFIFLCLHLCSLGSCLCLQFPPCPILANSSTPTSPCRPKSSPEKVAYTFEPPWCQTPLLAKAKPIPMPLPCFLYQRDRKARYSLPKSPASSPWKQTHLMGGFLEDFVVVAFLIEGTYSASMILFHHPPSKMQM